MTTIKYCIPCERYVQVIDSALGEFHVKTYQHVGEPVEYDTCEGMFVMFEPPVLTEKDWEHIFADEPSELELVQINQTAEEISQ